MNIETTIRDVANQVLDEETKKTIRKIQSDLLRIDRGEKFFFNIANFKKLGLIKEKDVFYTDAYGNKQRLRTDYFLTDKARQYLNVVL